MDDFLHHMLQLGDFAWELRNHRLEQLLRAPKRGGPGTPMAHCGGGRPPSPCPAP